MNKLIGFVATVVIGALGMGYQSHLKYEHQKRMDSLKKKPSKPESDKSNG